MKLFSRRKYLPAAIQFTCRRHLLLFVQVCLIQRSRDVIADWFVCTWLCKLTNMGIGKIYSRGRGSIEFLQGVAKRIIKGGATVVKFDFSNSETKRKTFFYSKVNSKYQASKSSRGLDPSLPPPP